MKKIVSLFTILTLVGALSLYVSAQQPVTGGQAPNAIQRHLGHKKLTPEQRAQMRKLKKQQDAEINRRLNLTQEQKQSFKKLRETTQSKIKPLHAQMQLESQKLRSLKASNAPQDQINEERAKLRSIKVKMKTIRKDHYEATKKLLTPQQQAEFEKIRQEKRVQRSPLSKHGLNLKQDK